jgi:ribosomal protein S6
VIFDTREQRESSDEMRQRIGTLMESLGAVVEGSESLGVRPFARCANRKFTDGAYARYRVRAEGPFHRELSGRLRLDKTVNRAFCERV